MLEFTPIRRKLRVKFRLEILLEHIILIEAGMSKGVGIMRILLFTGIALLSTASYASPPASPGSISQPLYQYWPKGSEEENAKRGDKGLDFLNKNVKSQRDLIVYAQGCRHVVKRPDYCAIPQMKELALSPSQRSLQQDLRSFSAVPRAN